MAVVDWALLALALIAAGAFVAGWVLAEIGHKLLRDAKVDEAKSANQIKLDEEERRVRELAARKPKWIELN